MKKTKTSQKELAIYLGVTESAISEYKKTAIGKTKVFLMLKGLEKIKEEKELRQNR